MNNAKQQQMNQNYLRFLLIFLLLWNNSYALRCGNNLVELGNTPRQVKEACGKPTHIRNITHENKHGKSVKIQWIYDFGPREFMYVLTFKQGKLEKIIPHGWGSSRVWKESY